MPETLHFEQLKKTFDAYFRKWWRVVSILYLLAFGLYTVGLFNKYLDFALPSFLRAIVTFEYWSWMGEMPVGIIGIGFISVGALSVGVVFIGAFSIGIVAFGGHSFGVITIAAGTRYGYEVGPRGWFDIGRAVGFIAISPEAYGVYALSYTGRGVYTLSPHHQDAVAVALFTRWMPKFKGAFSRAS